MPVSPPPPAPAPQDLWRRCLRLLLLAQGVLIAVHMAALLATGSEVRIGSVLGLEALLVLLCALGHERALAARGAGGDRGRGFMLLLLGIVLIALCVETGGTRSPHVLLLVLVSCYGALFLPSGAATLFAIVLAALFLAGAYVLPNGLRGEDLESLADRLVSRRPLDPVEASSLLGHAALLLLSPLVIHALSRAWRRRVATLAERAVRDPLTLLPNRRAFLEAATAEIGRHRRFAWPLSVLMVDLDTFKEINDLYGHAFGDRVLVESAAILADAIGPLDHLARLGGDEFCIAAVAAEAEHGADLAGRIVKQFRAHDWAALLPGLKITCSVGVVTPPVRPGPLDLSRLLDLADGALYAAKARGRNGFVSRRLAPPGSPAPPLPPAASLPDGPSSHRRRRASSKPRPLAEGRT